MVQCVYFISQASVSPISLLFHHAVPLTIQMIIRLTHPHKYASVTITHEVHLIYFLDWVGGGRVGGFRHYSRCSMYLSYDSCGDQFLSLNGLMKDCHCNKNSKLIWDLQNTEGKIFFSILNSLLFCSPSHCSFILSQWIYFFDLCPEFTVCSKWLISTSLCDTHTEQER